MDTMTNYREIALEAYGGREPGRMKASITAAIGIKRCSKCREWLPVESFGKSTGRADGLNHSCQGCLQRYYREWRGKPETAHKQREYTRKARQKDPERTARNRLRDRCRLFGITVEDYDRMLEAQGGGCAICGATAEDNGRALAIDHDHACCPGSGSRVGEVCGKCVRGLLCSPCNVAVGYFEMEDTRLKCQAYVERGRG